MAAAPSFRLKFCRLKLTGRSVLSICVSRRKPQCLTTMSNESDHLRAELEILWGRDRLMRSQIIYETIDLESAVERIITFHFCPATEKQDLFVSLMFENGQISLK